MVVSASRAVDACLTQIHTMSHCLRGRTVAIRHVIWKRPHSGSSLVAHASATPVRVSFRLPYRCNFGQNLRLVGSGAPLGDWDVSRSAAMTWSDGDVWKAELELQLGRDSAIEYKYVVVSEDGWCANWKPGANIMLLLPEVSNRGSAFRIPRVRAVNIMDSWDGSSRGVEYEVEEGGHLLADALADAGLPQDADVSSIFLAMRNAIVDLDEKITRTLEVVEGLDYPWAREAVTGDRRVATAARKALALAKAVEASSQAKTLEGSSGGPGLA